MGQVRAWAVRHGGEIIERGGVPFVRAGTLVLEIVRVQG
jgi:hypothetical protein